MPVFVKITFKVLISLAVIILTPGLVDIVAGRAAVMPGTWLVALPFLIALWKPGVSIPRRIKAFAIGFGTGLAILLVARAAVFVFIHNIVSQITETQRQIISIIYGFLTMIAIPIAGLITFWLAKRLPRPIGIAGQPS